MLTAMRKCLSVIIVNYNSGALTHACIESLQLHEDVESTEIIVVDNCSNDDSVAFLRADFPEITVIANKENRGLAAGVNQGIKAARGDYLLLLNPDIIVLDGAVNKLKQYLLNHSSVGVVGGKLLSPNGKLQNSAFRFYKPLTVLYRRTWLGTTAAGKREVDRFLMKDYDHQTARTVGWLMGSCYLLNHKAVDEVGGMDERFFLYFEDVDWCRRFWQKGWQVVYVPEAQFSHFHQRSSQRQHWVGLLTNWTTRAHIRSAIQYFWKYRGQKLPEVADR